MWLRQGKKERYLGGYCTHWLLGRGLELLVFRSREGQDFKWDTKGGQQPDYVIYVRRRLKHSQHSKRFPKGSIFDKRRPDYTDEVLERQRKEMLHLKLPLDDELAEEFEPDGGYWDETSPDGRS